VIFIYVLILMIYEAFDDKYRYQLINIEGGKLINGEDPDLRPGGLLTSKLISR
jgi:hypothetical protein